MSFNEGIAVQKEEDQASENSWLSDGSARSPSPAPMQPTDGIPRKPKPKRKRRKYHGTANVWTDDEVQKLLRRRWSGETWDATIAAFPHRTRDAVVKRYSTMKCEGKDLTPKKLTSSSDTSAGEELELEEHASKKRKIHETITPTAEHSRDEEINGVITVDRAKPLTRSSNQYTATLDQDEVSQTAFEVEPASSAAWTTVNRVTKPSEKPALTEQETARLNEFNKRGELVRRQLPNPRGSKTQWRAIRDREELTGDQTSRRNSATLPPSTPTTPLPNGPTQSSSNGFPRQSNGDHSELRTTKTARASSSVSAIKSPTISNDEVHPLTEAELSHRGIARRVEQLLLSELSKSESARGSREAELEKTILDLKARVQSLESNELRQAGTLKSQREEYKDVIHGMDEKIMVLDQEKKDIELDKLDLVDKLAEADDRAKTAEAKIANWNQEIEQSAMNTTSVMKEREKYIARIRRLELALSERAELFRDTTHKFEALSLFFDDLGHRISTLEDVYGRLTERRTLVKSHQTKMVEVRKKLDGDLSDFTGKMIKGLEDSFREEFAEVQNSFGKFDETFDQIGNSLGAIQHDLKLKCESLDTDIEELELSVAGMKKSSETDLLRETNG